MNWVVDGIFVAVILYFAIKNCIKGFMHTVYSIGKFVGAVLAAILIGRPLGEFISERFLRIKVSDVVYGKITQHVDGAELSSFFSNIPSGFAKIVKLFGVDMSLLKEQYSNVENSDAVIRDMASTIGYPIADIFSAIVAYIVVFAVVLLVLALIFKGLEKIKIPVLAGVDRIVGLIFGLILGMVFSSLIATSIYSAIEFIAAMSGNVALIDIYENSYVFKILYNLRIFEFVRNLI